jgi:hypothetical protein
MSIQASFGIVLFCALSLTDDVALEPRLEYEDVVGFVNSAWNFDSLSFLYEGTFRVIDAGRIAEKSRVAAPFNFQGSYIFRRDGSTYLDVYTYYLDAKHPPSHYTYAIDKGTLSQLRHSAQRVPRNSDIRKSAAVITSLANVPSPEQVLMHRSFLKAFRIDNAPLSHAFRFEGWQDLNNAHTLRFSINMHRGTDKEEINYKRYWLDVGRGYHVVKFEHYMNGRIAGSIDDVELTEIRGADGNAHWFPKRVTLSSYLTGLKGSSTTPVCRVVYSIVDSSIKINEPYGDQYFSVLYKPGLVDAARAKALEAEFRKSSAKPTDLDSAQRLLEARLREAEKQAVALDASTPGPWEALLGRFMPGSLLVAGSTLVACCLVVVVWRAVRRH